MFHTHKLRSWSYSLLRVSLSLALLLSLFFILSYLLCATLTVVEQAVRVCVEANRHNILQSRARCWKACWIFQWPAVLSCFPVFFFSPSPSSRFRLKTKLSLHFSFFLRSPPFYTLSLAGGKKFPLVCLSVLQEEVAWLYSDGGACLFLDLVGVLWGRTEKEQLDVTAASSEQSDTAERGRGGQLRVWLWLLWGGKVEKKSAVGVSGINFASALVGCTEFLSEAKTRLPTLDPGLRPC